MLVCGIGASVEVRAEEGERSMASVVGDCVDDLVPDLERRFIEIEIEEKEKEVQMVERREWSPWSLPLY
jgi:hypothetical protein